MRPTRRALTTGLTATALVAAWPVAGAAAVRADDRVVGKATAKVTVFEYASPTCPHCARWHTQVWPAFKAKYVDTGKVRFIFRELPTYPGNISSAAMMVARCAPANRYVDVVTSLMKNQATFAAGDVEGWLVGAGAAGGLTRDQVGACTQDQAGLDALSARLDANGKEHPEVTSTPTFVINGKVLAGEQSLAALDAVIQPLLRGKR